MSSRLRCLEMSVPVREQLKELTKQYEKSENDLKALQSVGQVTLRIFEDVPNVRCFI